MSEEWDEQSLDDEATLLSLEPGTYVERDGVVFVCGESGVRGVVPKKWWDLIRARYRATGT